MPCAFHLERLDLFCNLDPGCQFKVQENQLTEVGGAPWCDYHLPLRKDFKEVGQKWQWNDEQIKQFNKAVIALIRKACDEKVKCDLTGTVFPGAIDFSEIEVFPPVSFSNTQFGGHAMFEKAQFSGDATFEKAQFSGDARFEKAQFSGHARFEKAQFSGDAGFEEAQFRGHAGFEKAQFRGDAGFEEAQFRGYAGFVEAQFRGYAGFVEAQFRGYAWFVEAQFRGHARFVEAQFSDYAWFKEAQFSGYAGFEEAQFRGPATFEKAQFSGDAVFDSTGDTSTPEARRANTFHFVNFENVVFNGSVSFLNRQFLSTTKFKACVFTQAPAFHNCALHEDTNFDGTKFLDMSSEDAVRAYRTLKLAMENVRARQEEAMFYGLEQQSLRKKKDTPWSVWAMSHLYHLTSNYGQSFLRPLGWLTGITLVAFPIYLVYVTLACHSHCSGGYLGEVGVFTVLQLVRPLGVWTAEGRAALSPILGGNLPFVIMVIATFQSLISVSLVALFLLALRRRFKMG